MGVSLGAGGVGVWIRQAETRQEHSFTGCKLAPQRPWAAVKEG